MITQNFTIDVANPVCIIVSWKSTDMSKTYTETIRTLPAFNEFLQERADVAGVKVSALRLRLA